MEIVRQCKGTGCDFTRHCKYGQYVEPQPGRYIKQWMPTEPGENCPDYEAYYADYGKGACDEA